MHRVGVVAGDEEAPGDLPPQRLRRAAEGGADALKDVAQEGGGRALLPSIFLQFVD